MKPKHTIIHWASAALASCALAAAGAATAAQQDAATQKVEVQASRTITLNGTRVGGDTVSLSQTVKYGDLDLASAAGVQKLTSRIHATATAVCTELGRLYPAPGALEVNERTACVKSAMDGAMGEAHVAISTAARQR